MISRENVVIAVCIVLALGAVGLLLAVSEPPS